MKRNSFETNGENPMRVQKENGLLLVHMASWAALACACLAILLDVTADKRVLLKLIGDAPLIVLLFAEFFICRDAGDQSPKRLFLFGALALAAHIFLALFGVIALSFGNIARGLPYFLAFVPAVLFFAGSIRIKKAISPRRQDEEIGR